MKSMISYYLLRAPKALSFLHNLAKLADARVDGPESAWEDNAKSSTSSTSSIRPTRRKSLAPVRN